MGNRTASRRACGVGLAGLVALAWGCHATTTECFCDSAAAITILAPAGAVTGVKVSGAACASVWPSCEGTASDRYPPGCATTLLFPRHAGTCDVEVDLIDGGAVRQSVELVDPGTCCGGVRASDPRTGTIVIGADAGVDRG